MRPYPNRQAAEQQPQKLLADLRQQTQHFQTAQRQWLEERDLRLKFEHQLEILRDDVIPQVLEYGMSGNKQIVT